MNRRTIGLPLILFLFWVIACDLSSLVSNATPAPDSVATRVAEAKAVAATLTADASIARWTPLPTDIPKPTSTQTQTSTPTSVPSTRTPAPTPTIPKGWRTYTIQQNGLTFYYPGNWTYLLGGNDPFVRTSSVMFQQKDEAGERALYVGEEKEQFQLGSSLDADVNRFAEYLIGQFSSLPSKTEMDAGGLARRFAVSSSGGVASTLSKGIWDDGVHSGVFSEFSIRRSDSLSNYAFFVALRVDNKTVHIAWVRSQQNTDTPLETLKILSASINLKR